MRTPAGVGMGFEPPRFLKSGDVIEYESSFIINRKKMRVFHK
jgi:2-keto-4-pentenoate hydratase/2-oxohepta-3-ene-1,7-dioic acid hydratase in catechol pathway